MNPVGPVSPEDRAYMDKVKNELVDVLEKNFVLYPDKTKFVIAALSGMTDKTLRKTIGEEETAKYYYILADELAVSIKSKVSIPKFKKPDQS